MTWSGNAGPTRLARMRGRGRHGGPGRQGGGALVEYTIVALVLLLALLAGPDVIHMLADALRKAYASFVYALSISWF